MNFNTKNISIFKQLPRKIFINSNSGFILADQNGKSYFATKNLPAFLKSINYSKLLKEYKYNFNFTKHRKNNLRIKAAATSFISSFKYENKIFWYEISFLRFRHFNRKDFLFLVNDISKFKIKEEELKNKIFIDDLTDLYNKKFLYNSLESEISRLGRVNKPLSVIFIDIDNFKSYNDFFGHIEGDKCLVKVSDIIKSCLFRKSDIPIRFGGDEFICILPYTDQNGAHVVAKRIQEKITGININIPIINSSLSISQGIFTIYSKDNIKAENIIHLADEALYSAKKEGKNRIFIYKKQKSNLTNN